MNILFCSVGRRAELIKCFKNSLSSEIKIVGTDCSNTAPALHFCDKKYIVPRITEDSYIDIIIEICRKEKIDVITTLIDPEIEILSMHKSTFKENNILLLGPDLMTAKLCFDKYEMFKFLTSHGIKTIKTYNNTEDFQLANAKKEVDFPVFVKPRFGSGSVGARKIDNLVELVKAFEDDRTLIIQELMIGDDIDVDVYVDVISNKPVSMFSKRKLETKIGGANKTISFIDERLFSIIEIALSHFHFSGALDIDFFYCDGEYYLSEINPRFGGAYIHAYGCGIDFIKLIFNNLNGVENYPTFRGYDQDVVMMMFDTVVIKKISELDRYIYCI